MTYHILPCCIILLSAAPLACGSDNAIDERVDKLGRATGPISSTPEAPPPVGSPQAPAHFETTADEAAGALITGRVLETIDASRYTYVQVAPEAGAPVWTAVPRVQLAKGETVTVIQSLVMRDFESKTLGRVFPTVVFGILSRQAGGPGEPASEPEAGVQSDPTAE